MSKPSKTSRTVGSARQKPAKSFAGFLPIVRLRVASSVGHYARAHYACVRNCCLSRGATLAQHYRFCAEYLFLKAVFVAALPLFVNLMHWGLKMERFGTAPLALLI